MGKSSELRTSRAPCSSTLRCSRTASSTRFHSGTTGSEARGDSSPRSARPVRRPLAGQAWLSDGIHRAVLPTPANRGPRARCSVATQPQPSAPASCCEPDPRPLPAGRSPDDPPSNLRLPARQRARSAINVRYFRGAIVATLPIPASLAILALMSTPEIQFAALTDVGRVREHNEDNFLVDKKLGLFVVCDGMGGHAAGEVASALAVRTLHEEIKKEADLIQDYAKASKGAAKSASATS